MVGVKMQVPSGGAWATPPYAVRQLLLLVPFSAGELDSSNVVREIKDGEQPTGVVLESIEGEKREPGDVCFLKATGVMIGAHANEANYEYSQYLQVAGAWMPGHIEYRELHGFALSADIVMTQLEDLPEGAFVFPEGSKVETMCSRFLCLFRFLHLSRPWQAVKVAP